MNHTSLLPRVVNLGSKPKPPQQSEASKELERLQIAQIQQNIKLQAEKAKEVPIAAPKPLVYAPPPNQTSADLAAQAREQRQAAFKNSSFLQSVKAGSTGGFKGGMK